MAITTLSRHEATQYLKCPFVSTKVVCGFPSPADDYIESTLDLNHLIKHPAATYYCRTSGDSMQAFGIMDGALLVVDRAIKPYHQAIIIAVLNGEFTCKQWDAKRLQLTSGNMAFPPIQLSSQSHLECEGVVIHAINSYVSPR